LPDDCEGHCVLEVSGLGCLRGERRLFAGVSFSLRPGGLIWIQGGNGSGKTTLLRTLCGLTHAMAGEVRWGGEPIQALGEDYRRELTYIGHANGLKEELSAQENLLVAPAASRRACGGCRRLQASPRGASVCRSFVAGSAGALRWPASGASPHALAADEPFMHWMPTRSPHANHGASFARAA
jgi:ABC-type sugar transport system ATPase subunit